MVKHVIVKVGLTHHGSLTPGTMLVILADSVGETGTDMVSFRNPSDGGWSLGQLVDPDSLNFGFPEKTAKYGQTTGPGK